MILNFDFYAFWFIEILSAIAFPMGHNTFLDINYETMV